MVKGVCRYAERNGIDNFNVKVIKRLLIEFSMTLRLFIEIEPSKLGQWGLLGIFSCAIHNVTLYDSIFACKNILALVIIILSPTFAQPLGFDHEKTNRPDFTC